MSYGLKPAVFFLYSIALILLSAQALASVSEIALKQKDAVVTIFAFGKEKDSLGSGFVINKDGVVVTNYHVAKSCMSEKTTCIVKMESGAFFPVIAVVAVDEANDLALVRVKGKGLPTVRLAREQSGKLGESVVVIGSPKGLETTVSDGIVSAIRGDGEVLQITAPISPGSSGSPVFNSKGEVIGVATFTTEGQNLNFAIPVKFVHGLYREYTASLRITPNKYAKRAIETKPEPPKVKPPKLETKPEPPKVEPPKPGPTTLDPAEVKKARIDGLIRMAKTELSQKRFDEARQSCNAVIELDPNIAEAFSLRSDAYNNLGSYPSALSDADRAIGIDPSFDKAHANRGLANASLGKFAEAIKDVDRALALNPSLAGAYNIRSWAENELGNYNQALSDANRAISIDSTISGPHSNRGVAHQKLGNLKEALNDYNTALKIDPNNYISYINRCGVYSALGNYDQALQDCNEATRLNPRSYLTYANRSVIYYMIKDYNRAYDDTSTSLSLKASVEAYQIRCLSCIELKKYSEAVTDCTNAIELKPQEPAPYHNRGAAFYKMGEKERAIPDFQIAARMGFKQAQDTLRYLGVSW